MIFIENIINNLMNLILDLVDFITRNLFAISEYPKGFFHFDLLDSNIDFGDI